MRTISFAGVNYVDIVLMLARLFISFGDKIAVEDHSKQHSMYTILDGDESPEKGVSARGIDYYVSDVPEDYDLRIRLYDIEVPLNEDDDLLIVVAREDRDVYERLVHAAGAEDECPNSTNIRDRHPLWPRAKYDETIEDSGCILIVRDCCAAIPEMFASVQYALATNEVHYIELSSQDREISISLEFYENYNFKKISKKLHDCIMSVFAHIHPETTQHERRKLYRIATNSNRRK